MTFWNWRRGPGPSATQGSAALASSPELAPIEIYTADSRIVGWIAPDGQRVTDLLNSRDELRLWRPSPDRTDEVGMPAPGEEVGGESGAWEGLATARVVLAMPPEWRASRQLRLHRRLRRAALVAGPVQHHRQRSRGQRRAGRTAPASRTGLSPPHRCVLPPQRGAFVRARRERRHRQLGSRQPDRSARHPRLSRAPHARDNRPRWPSSALPSSRMTPPRAPMPTPCAL